MRNIRMLLVLITFYSFSQGLLPLEKTTIQDNVIRSYLDSSRLIILNNHDYRKDVVFGVIPSVSSVIKIFDLDNRTVLSHPFFSTSDSNTTLVDIVMPSIPDTIRYIRRFYDSGIFLNSTYYLVTTNNRFDFQNEIALNIPVAIDEIYNSYIKNNQLFFSGLLGYYMYRFKTDLNTGLTSIIEFKNGLHGLGPTVHLNDSIRFEIRSFLENTIYQIKNDSTIVTSHKFSSFGFEIGYKAKLFGNKIYITGLRDDNTFPSTYDLKTVFIYDIDSNTTKEIFLDTIPRFFFRSEYGIDLIDTNHIYTFTTGGSCWSTPYSATCDNYFRVYSIKSDGTLNWQHTLGGFANYYPFHVIATPDTGALFLVQKYDENDPGYSQDCYWIKYDKNGIQDRFFLDGFRDVTSVNEIKSRELSFSFYPNPATDIIQINYIKESPIRSIEIFDITGKLVLSEFTSFKQLDISGLNSGQYLLRVIDKENNVAFVHAYKFYHTYASSSNKCPIPGSIDDGFHCMVAVIPPSCAYFVWNNNWYVKGDKIPL